MPNDGAERIADVLVLETEQSDRVADFAAANPDDIADKLRGIGGDAWWKLTILIAADNGQSSQIELVAVVGSDPGPIILDNWIPRGEQILEHHRAEIDRKKKERKEERAKAKATSQPTPDTSDSHK